MANLPALARFSFFPSCIRILTASGGTEKFLHTALVISCASPLFCSIDLPSSASIITSGIFPLLMRLINYNIHVPRATAADLTHLKALGSLFGILTFCGTIGGAAGPFVFGLIFDNTGSYKMAFLILIGIIIAGFFLVLFIKPVRKNKYWKEHTNANLLSRKWGKPRYYVI